MSLLEEAVRQKTLAAGSVEDVVETIGYFREELGVEHLSLFLDYAHLDAGEMTEQLHLISEEVMPRLGVTMTGPPDPTPRRELS